MFYYKIDHQHGTAEMFVVSEPLDPIKRFLRLAEQCFGIRKSIGAVRIIEKRVEPLPAWFSEKTAAILKHDGDLIIWDSEGIKIKSEFDD